MSEQPPEGNGALLKWRVQNQGNRLEKIEGWKDAVDQDRAEVKGDLKAVQKELTSLGDEVHGLRRVLIGFSFTFAGSALVFAFSILAATGKL